MGKELRLALLGNVDVRWDAAAVTAFTSRKSLALLCYLAVTGRPHLRPTLAGLLWGNLPEDRAGSNLRKALTNLRHLVGPHLSITRQEIAVNQDDAYWLDVEAFEVHVASASAEAPSAQARVEHLQKAVRLYRGDFLEGFYVREAPPFEEWTLAQRARLRELAVQAMHMLIVHQIRRGEAGHASGMDYATRLLALEPWREEAHRQLMVLLARSGQRSAALSQFETCRRVLDGELGVAPGVETTRLYERIRDGRADGELGLSPDLAIVALSPPPPRPRHNLPTQPIPFVGRQEELSGIRECLDDPTCRLLTLVGPGGSGKTRLAIEAAASHLDHFEHGVFFVSLAPVRSTESIVPTLAQAVGFSFHGRGDQEQQLLAYLTRRQVLLILDNFEHLLSHADGTTGSARPPGMGGALGLVTSILETAPAVKLLVTSRAGLRVQRERLFPIAGMAYPGYQIGWFPDDRPGDAADYAAVQLFVQGSRRMMPDFELSTDNTAGVVEVCRHVAGMPVGVLLASAWVRMLSPAEIAAQLERGPDLLTTDLHDVPERQRSMRAVFDHSWNLLTSGERAVLQALSVFRGGFTGQAARVVAGASLHDLRSLVDRSLVQPADGGRYKMHELLRQYAGEKLVQSPAGSQEARDRHGAHYAAAVEAWEADLKGPHQIEAQAEMDVEIANARAAWNWAAERGDVRRLSQAIDGLSLFYERRARFDDGESACRTAVGRLGAIGSGQAPGPIGTTRLLSFAKLLAWQSYFAFCLGRAEQADQLIRQSLGILTLPELAGDDCRSERAFVLHQMGKMAAGHVRAQARHLYEQALALYDELGDRWGEANALEGLGGVAQSQGDFEEAMRFHTESLDLRQSLGDRLGTARSLTRLSDYYSDMGELEQAVRFAQDALEIYQDAGNRQNTSEGLGILGVALAMQGRFAGARQVLKQSVAIAGDLGMRSLLASALCVLADPETQLGLYEVARGRVTMSLRVGGAVEDRVRLQACFRQLGNLALVEEEYGEALRYFEKSAALNREIGRRHVLGLTVALQGLAELGQDRPRRARECLQESLRAHAASGSLLITLYSLPVLALLMAREGHPEMGIELYALASHQPFVRNSRFWEDVVGLRIAEVAAGLPPDTVAAAKARGRARDVQATLGELIAEWGEAISKT